MSKFELLAPAGNMECLGTALNFGADAVYIGGKRFGLRSFAQNFDAQEMTAAVELGKEYGAKVYVTVNAVMDDKDMAQMPEYLAEIKRSGAQAVIVSDPGMIGLCKTAGLEIHLSTQASTMNAHSVKFWWDAGVTRVVMARESSLENIKSVHRACPEMEIEAFVHGAMCIAYSGRCLLSSVLTDRSGNKGECAQPCRWEYEIREVGREKHFTILEDARGTYLLNSNDLCMVEHMSDLMEAGVTSFKIEGRMKSTYYVASVVHAYRLAMDDALAGRPFDPKLLEYLESSASRNFTTGFFYGNPQGRGQDISRTIKKRTQTFAAVVAEDSRQGRVNIIQRNRFFEGEEFHVLSPHSRGASFKCEDIRTMGGEERTHAPHPCEPLNIKCELPLKAGDILTVKR